MTDQSTTTHTEDDQHPTLESQLHKRVSDWLASVAPRLATGELEIAKITLTVAQACAEEDDTLALEWEAEEQSCGPLFDGDKIGHVPGVKYGGRA